MNTNLFKEEIDATIEWCEHEYNDRFGVYFKDIKDMRKRFQSTDQPITDKELSWILIDLPMVLFDVSEKLSQLKVAAEVVKLRMKEQEVDLMSKSTAKTITQKRAEAELQLTEPKAQLAVYKSVISRVDNELDLARELIMGSKKVWDARRRTEGIHPVNIIEPIPEYKNYGEDVSE